MPYISFEQRPLLDKDIDSLIQSIKTIPLDDREGVLNYTLSRIISGSMKPDEGWRYKIINRIMGVLSCVQLEFYRRIASPYEDKAILKNEDIKEYLM
jgi:hypothetical protein